MNFPFIIKIIPPYDRLIGLGVTEFDHEIAGSIPDTSTILNVD